MISRPVSTNPPKVRAGQAFSSTIKLFRLFPLSSAVLYNCREIIARWMKVKESIKIGEKDFIVHRQSQIFRQRPTHCRRVALSSLWAAPRLNMKRKKRDFSNHSDNSTCYIQIVAERAKPHVIAFWFPSSADSDTLFPSSRRHKPDCWVSTRPRERKVAAPFKRSAAARVETAYLTIKIIFKRRRLGLSHWRREVWIAGNGSKKQTRKSITPWKISFSRLCCELWLWLSTSERV